KHICIFYIIIFRKSVFASKNLPKYNGHVSIFSLSRENKVLDSEARFNAFYEIKNRQTSKNKY
ncbi:hypothetical protein D478_00225, partial [Brevibacillus agri BAB-2500]